MVPPLTTSLPTIHHLHMSREAANIPDTQKRSPPLPPGGLWVPGRKQCFWQSITERLPAFVLAPAQAQSAWSRSPGWAEAGLCWGGRGRGLRDTYERPRIQLDFPPSACRYLRTEDAVCFRGNSESTPSYGNSPSSTPPPAPVNPEKTRQSNGSIKSKINLSFHTEK